MFNSITIAIIKYYLLPPLLFSIISIITCGGKSRHDEFRDSEESYSYASTKTEEGQTSKSKRGARNMRKLLLPTLTTPVAEEKAEKDVHVPESIVTEEIFVPIGKSSRDPIPQKGVMTAKKNKITAQVGIGISHTRIPPPPSIRFTEERHRSRTINIFSEQKPEK
ncbi:Translation initiation factor [Dirofilaria immitis]